MKSRLDRGDTPSILDVLEPHEYSIVNLGAPLIPLGKLSERFQELDPSKELVVYCKSGVRSAKAVAFLRKKGYSKAKNLAGGIDAWAQRIDRKLPRY